MQFLVEYPDGAFMQDEKPARVRSINPCDTAKRADINRRVAAILDAVRHREHVPRIDGDGSCQDQTVIRARGQDEGFFRGEFALVGRPEGFATPGHGAVAREPAELRKVRIRGSPGGKQGDVLAVGLDRLAVVPQG